jgi:hypothetical protein
MKSLPQADSEAEQRASSPLLDVLIRASLIGLLAVLCYQIFSPFLTLMVWAIILAVTLYPLHQWLAEKVSRKQWLASTILVIVGLLLIITPMALLMNSFADSVRHFIGAVQQNRLAIPAPREGPGSGVRSCLLTFRIFVSRIWSSISNVRMPYSTALLLTFDRWQARNLATFEARSARTRPRG